MPRGVYERKPRLRTQVSAPGDSGPDLPESREGGIRDLSVTRDDIPHNLKVCIYPKWGEEDKGDGGIRRVVEGQLKHLPACGVEVVSTPEEADLIACHIEIPPAWVKLYSDKPIVAMIHGLYWDEYQWQNWALEANARVMELMRLADAITAPSEWVAEAIRRNVSRPVEVIPHGIDTSEWAPEGSMGYVLWNKTRPDPVCDPEPVNEVAKILPNVEFISTFGDEAPNVTLTGRLPFEQAKRLIVKAGVYLATSKETFGIGTLEAMAAGVPVVGYSWGGQVDIVRHGYDGFLVPPGDVHNLALAIEGAIQDREALSVNARERAEDFSWRKAAEAYAALFRKVIDCRRVQPPKTSVIVTNYNLHEYLGDCLSSVAGQTDRDWECIVVDDASPDQRGREIANEWAAKDPRFKVVENPSNLYLAEARNTGIRVARGRYILPLDADDMLPPNAIATLSRALDSDRNTHIAYGRVQFVKEDGRTLEIYEGHEDNPGYSAWPFPFVYEHQIHQRNFLPYSSMFRHEVWKDTGGYRPRCRTAEDADFWTRVSSYGFRPTMVTQEPTLIYRNRPDSMSRVQSLPDWIKWFPWSKDSKLTPAGAVTQKQLPVPSFDRPLISVIIPVGPAHRRLVKDAIDSVDAQSFREWECIVINDSGRPLDELPAWVHIIEAPHRAGVAAARNLGIRAAKAPLFLPLDADDYLQPHALQWMLDAFMETRDIIYSDFWEDPQTPGELKVYREKDFADWKPTRGVLHAVTALTPKAVWEKVGGYDEDLPGWEDWDFQLKCADIGVCSRRLASPVWVYRKHTGERREENVANFETSKNGILSKWSDLWGGKELMACRSCSARAATINPSGSPAASKVAKLPASPDEVVLVQYTGGRMGNTTYKGKSGTFYIFNGHENTKYVLKKDLAIFEGRQDFKILPHMESEVVDAVKTPVLVAEGKP